ncbi:toxin glutamine deamidase domain-containing protein [Streptomyces sp. NPDC051664]|uniref:toxin glutamine deamidase domain-containing protein n=1 Tax=Streptomyces sp. NPDC051664 TaxID=3365668 RepID=UPI00378C2823
MAGSPGVLDDPRFRVLPRTQPAAGREPARSGVPRQPGREDVRAAYDSLPPVQQNMAVPELAQHTSDVLLHGPNAIVGGRFDGARSPVSSTTNLSGTQADPAHTSDDSASAVVFQALTEPPPAPSVARRLAAHNREQRRSQLVAELDEAGLRELVDRVVAKLNPGGTAAKRSPHACVTLLQGFEQAVYPGALSEATAGREVPSGLRTHQATDDMLVGSGQAEHTLARGRGWRRVDSWDTMAQAVEEAGPGATGLVLWQQRQGEGHAFALHHTTDVGVRWVELQASPDVRVRATRPRLVAADTRAVVIDATGRVLEDALPRKSPADSTAFALMDPPASHQYGAIGDQTEETSSVLSEPMPLSSFFVTGPDGNVTVPLPSPGRRDRYVAFALHRAGRSGAVSSAAFRTFLIEAPSVFRETHAWDDEQLEEDLQLVSALSPLGQWKRFSEDKARNLVAMARKARNDTGQELSEMLAEEPWGFTRTTPLRLKDADETLMQAWVSMTHSQRMVAGGRDLEIARMLLAREGVREEREAVEDPEAELTAELKKLAEAVRAAETAYPPSDAAARVLRQLSRNRTEELAMLRTMRSRDLSGLTGEQMAALVVVERLGRQTAPFARAHLIHRLRNEVWPWAKRYPTDDEDVFLLLDKVHEFMRNQMHVTINMPIDRDVDGQSLLDRLITSHPLLVRTKWEVENASDPEKVSYFRKRGATEELLGYTAALGRTADDGFQSVRSPFRSENGKILPKYGALTSRRMPDSVIDFGNAAFHLKQAIRDRVTHTAQDSIDGFDYSVNNFGLAGAPGVTGPDHLLPLLAWGAEPSVRLAFAEATDFEYDPALRFQIGRDARLVGDRIISSFGDPYFETQIHGDVSWSDVEHIVLRHDDRNYMTTMRDRDKLLKFSVDHGLTYSLEVLPKDKLSGALAIPVRFEKWIKRNLSYPADFRGPSLRALSLPRTSDGELSERAVELSSEARGRSIKEAFEFMGQVGVDASGVSENVIRGLASHENLARYPELQSYMDRPDLTIDRDRNATELTQLQSVNVGSMRIEIYSDPSESNAITSRRIAQLTEAIRRAQMAGYSIPDMEVRLPKYTRHITIQANGNIIEDDGIYEVMFDVPNILILPSSFGAEMNRAKFPDRTNYALEVQFDDWGTAAIIRGIGDFLHYTKSPSGYFDLNHTIYTSNGVAKIAGELSLSAAQDPRNFIGQYFLGEVVGRTPSENQRAMYADLGGPVADAAPASGGLLNLVG